MGDRGDKRILQFLRRYGLAACCIAGPLIFGLATDYLATQWLIPFSDPSTLSESYRAAVPGCAPTKATESTPESKRQETVDTRRGPPAKSSALPNETGAPSCADLAKALSGETWQDVNDPDSIVKIWTISQQYRGRITYVVASTFLYLIAAVILFFGFSVVAWEKGLGWAFSAFIAFFVVAAWCAGLGFLPKGRTLIVEDILNRADNFFPFLNFVRSGTGTRTAELVEFNTFASFLPIGMLLSALYVLSLQPKEDKLVLATLKRRLTLLRMALGLGSTLLVVGVLAQKSLMVWPLSLIQSAQAEHLQPLANALTLQVGAQGTIALCAAFGPAIIAWSLDAADFRKEHPALNSSPNGENKEAAASGKSTSGEHTFAFASFSSIASFLALLAPLLTSPLVDAFKSALSLLAKGSP
jgi:hypothetical protein